MMIWRTIRRGSQLRGLQTSLVLASSLLFAWMTGTHTAAAAQKQQPAVQVPVRTMPLTLPEENLPDGFVGLPFGSSVTAVGGSGLYSVLVSGDLPPGMVLARGGGVVALVGTPTREGTYVLRVAVTDISLGTSRSHDYSVHIGPELVHAQAAAATVTVSDTESLHFADVPSVFFPAKIVDLESFSFSDGENAFKPAGIALGEAFHFGDVASVFVPVLILDTETFHFSDTATVTTKLGIDPTTTPAGTAGVAYSQAFKVVGNTGTASLSLAGYLPAGVGYSCTPSSSCTISGTPKNSGTFVFKLIAQDSLNTTTVNYSLVIAGAAQTINLGPLPTPVYGGAPFSVSATATSGLPVTIQYLNGPATGSGNGPYTATGAGVVNFTATQAGDNSYAAAAPVNFSVTIAAAPQSIQLGTLPTPSYGGAPFSVSATATSGLPVTIQYVNGPATGSGNGPYTATGAGTVNYTATQTGNANYTAAAPVNFSVVIGKQASVTTVSANPASITPLQTTTLTANVSGVASGSPAGTVTFFDNGLPLGSPVPLAGGQAQMSTLLPSGAQVISAAYSGDSNFLASTSATNPTVSMAPLDFTMTLLSPASTSVVPGATAVVSFNITPLYLLYPGPVSFSVSGLPGSATYTVTPTSVTANGGPQTITVTITTAAATAHGQVPSHGVPIALGLFVPLLAMGALRRRRRWLHALMLAIGVFAASAVVGCGAYSTGNGFFGQAAKTYPVTITASSGTVQHAVNVALEIQ